MKSHYDVAIIGGGVIGGSIAYQLAKRGSKVVLLEKDRLASQSSQAAAGMLGAQVELGTEVGPLFELAVKSRAMFRELTGELKDISGIDFGFVDKGMLKVAFEPEQVAEFQEIIDAQQKMGQPVEWMNTTEVIAREPEISGEILGGMYIPGDGQVSAPELSLAFAKSAAALGAEIREHTEVLSLVLEQGSVKGVVTAEETISCDKVVICAGAWSGILLKPMGIDLPVYPVKGECFSVLTHKPLITSTVFSHGCYMVPKRGGRLVVGATMKEHTYDRKVSFDGLATLVERAKRLLPQIREAEWEKAWAGIRPQTGDGMPYLGEHGDWKGLLFATGHFRNGILLSPITGCLIADLIEGKTSEINLSSFSPTRHLIVKQ
jgi:glycine oxidase